MIRTNLSQLQVLVSKMREDNKQKNFKGFFCSPQQIDGSSVLVKLKNIIGVTNDDKKTFNTPFIYMGSTTNYNGFDLSLGLTGDGVTLIVKVLNTNIVGGFWSLQDLTKRMKTKNDGVTHQTVSKLIQDGRMGVKFNVRTKDHGTQWKVQPLVLSTSTSTEDDDDFFQDL